MESIVTNANNKPNNSYCKKVMFIWAQQSEVLQYSYKFTYFYVLEIFYMYIIFQV